MKPWTSELFSCYFVNSSDVIPVSLERVSMKQLLLLLLVALALFTLVSAWSVAIQLGLLVAVLWWLFKLAGLFRRNRAVR